MTLHRRIVRSLGVTDDDAYLQHICRSAAKTRLISAMDFVNRLKPEHLCSFWPFPSRINFALVGTFGSLLRVTAPSHEEAEFYRLRLGEYRWTLTASRRCADVVQPAIEHLDACAVLLQDLEKAPLSETTSSSSSAVAVSAADKSNDGGIGEPQPTLSMRSAGRSLVEPSSTNSGLASPSTSTSGDSEASAARMAPGTWSAGLAHADVGLSLISMEGVVMTGPTGGEDGAAWS